MVKRELRRLLQLAFLIYIKSCVSNLKPRYTLLPPPPDTLCQWYVICPQFKEVVGDDTIRPWIIELWRLAPTPDAARRIRVSSVQRILKRHRIRRIGAQQVLGIVRSKEINLMQATVSSCVWRVKSIIEFLDIAHRQLKEIENRIKEMLDLIISREKTRKTRGQENQAMSKSSCPCRESALSLPSRWSSRLMI